MGSRRSCASGSRTMVSALARCSIRRVIAAVLLVAYGSGCTGWHRLPETQPAPKQESPQSLRVTLRNGERIELRKAKVIGDSVIGEFRSDPNEPQVRFALAVADITRIEDRKVSTGKTIVFVTALAGVLGVAGLLVFIAATQER